MALTWPTLTPSCLLTPTMQLAVSESFDFFIRFSTSPTGPAEHWAGGSLLRSCNSLLILLRARAWEPWFQCNTAVTLHVARYPSDKTFDGRKADSLLKYDK
jgi:hypothetical protein